MRTEPTGGSSRPGIEDRLARRFAVELTRAEADYPAIGSRGRPSDRVRRVRVAAIPVALVVLVLATLVAVQFGPLRSGVGTAPQSPAPSSSGGVTLGADGLPTAIDGERVYRPADVPDRTGSFLVAGTVNGHEIVADGFGSFFSGSAQPEQADQVGVRAHVTDAAISCANANHCTTIAIDQVVWRVSLPASVGGRTVQRPESLDPAKATGEFALGGVLTRDVSPCPAATMLPGAELLGGCGDYHLDALSLSHRGKLPDVGDRAVVVLAHAHDPRAALCDSQIREACQEAVVVDGVLWPDSIATVHETGGVALGPDGVPITINGEQVYRGAYPPDEDVLVAGVPTSELRDCGSGTTCETWLFDGSAVSSGAASLSPRSGHMVVARVFHRTQPVNCPSGAACPFAGETVTIESIAWDSGSTWVVMGSDGIPTSVGGYTVGRLGVPSQGTERFVGGLLTRDPKSCPNVEPTPNPSLGMPVPPTCGYWMIDGQKVAANPGLLDPFNGQRVVVGVSYVSVEVDCARAPCTEIGPFVLVGSVVWSESKGAG